LGDIPVATVVSGAVDYIHVDHLNTPRLVANQAGTAVWRWDQREPFGIVPPDENPSGLGVLHFNLRFPGQYFDRETITHYNDSRDYAPAVGRYTESDAIGLRGGINTYAYVKGNPVAFTDPSGESLGVAAVVVVGVAVGLVITGNNATKGGDQALSRSERALKCVETNNPAYCGEAKEAEKAMLEATQKAIESGHETAQGAELGPEAVELWPRIKRFCKALFR